MIDILLQIIIVAFPQAACTIAFCLLMTNKFDLLVVDETSGKLKISSIALLKLAIPSFCLAFLSIVLRSLRVVLFLVPIILLSSTYITILITYRINKLSEALKLFVSFLLYSIIIGIIEVIVTPIIISIKGITVYDVFDSFYINLISSIPCIISLFFIDVVIFIRKKTLINISIIKSIAESKVLIITSVILIIANSTHIAVYTMILNDKLLKVYSTNQQILMNAVLMTFPAINLGGIWFLLYSVKYKEAIDMRVQRDEMIKKISIANERSRMSREVHDTLGHSLTVIIKLLEVCKMTSYNADKINEQLEEAIRIAQNGFEEVRHSVSGILEEKILNRDFFTSLMELASEFENNSGISVDITTQGVVEDVSKKHSVVLYSICKEALTNSLRHGKAKNIGIVIKFESRNIKLLIFDDGVGCKKINIGYGFKGMEQRIIDVNGKMEYKSDKGQGFILNFEIPKEEVGKLA